MYRNECFNMKCFMLTLMCGIVFGASVPSNVAQEVAKSIFDDNKHLHGRDQFQVSHVEMIKDGGKELIYVFHLNPKGFVMVPADDQAVPNLAFGFDHSFDGNDMSYALSIFDPVHDGFMFRKSG